MTPPDFAARGDMRGRERLLVLGAGLAGSLLVQALARHRVACAVELVDSRVEPNAGRRWAAFEPASDPDPDPGHGLRRVRIVCPTGARVLELREHVYAVHHGDDLDRETDVALHELGGVRRTAHVDDVTPGKDRVCASTDAGPICADRAFVSTEPSRASPPAAWMHFLGWEVRTPPAAIDVGTVTLMDFSPPQRGQVRFVYVLATATDRVLVELTAFTPTAACPELAHDLRAYLDRELVGWSLVGEETGTVPLSPRRIRRRRGRVLDIGVRGGLLRASTGYGYRPLVRDAELIAADLAAGRSPRGFRRRWRHAAMDAVLLRLVAEDPPTVVIALERLFARNPPDRVVRFLNEESSVVEEAAMVATLPVRPFFAAALATASHRAATIARESGSRSRRMSRRPSVAR